MNATDRAAVVRVRLLVLQQIMAAGGSPAAWQVARALRPLGVELLTDRWAARGRGPERSSPRPAAIVAGGRAFTCRVLDVSSAGLSRPATVESGSSPSASSPPF